MIKFIQDVIPFLAPYPSWVKGLVIFWAFLSLATASSLVFAMGPSAPKKRTSETVYFTIKSIDGPSKWIRLTVYINGKAFAYPSLAGVKWAEIGPAMSEQTYEVEVSDMPIKVRFQGAYKSSPNEALTEVVSQQTQRVDTLPAEEIYGLYSTDPGMAGRVSTPNFFVTYRIEGKE